MNVGVHQGSVLSPLFFIIVMEAVTYSVREGLPWEMLYTDDLVLVGKCEEELKRRDELCWIKRIETLQVDGDGVKGRPKKRWREVEKEGT